MMARNKAFLFGAALLAVFLATPLLAQADASIDHPIAKLRSLDKITARTTIFEATVGSTLKFGNVYIKVRACRKAPEMEKPEAASFIQVWEVPPGQTQTEEKAEWIFSGWLFSSSPGLSSMDHPIYDVWVLDCLQKKAAEPRVEESDESLEGEGELPENAAPEQPAIAP
jgi:hypothetical protein